MSIHEQFTQRQAASTLLQCLLDLTRRWAIANRSNQGFTLIEGLLAIVIIAITVVSITPPIVWATATRIQTQRGEQALKLAQGEIDRVRSIVERNETGTTALNALLPPAVPGATETQVRDRTSGKVPAPSAPKDTARLISTKDCGKAVNDDGSPPSQLGQYLRVDTNGDCQADFLIQTFRSEGLDEDGQRFDPTGTKKLAAFVMGVRVYAAIAEPKLKAGKGGIEPASLRGTSGLGNQTDRPLAVLYSTIVRSTDSKNLNLYRQLCPDASKNSGAC